MENQEFNEIQKELDEHESLLFEIFNDPPAYNESTGRRIGQGGPYPASISQVMQTLLPDWTDVKIQNGIKGLESQGLIERVSSDYNLMRTDLGIRVLQNKLTEKGKEYAQWLSLTAER